MQISIIIPTYNRNEDLDICLNSIIHQTKLPKEIIVVDDSDNDKIEKLIEHRKQEFNAMNIFFKYIRNKKEKSLTIARNIGVEHTTGDIILYLDSDVILEKNYIIEILNTYEKHQNALGVQGYITNIDRPSKIINIIWKNLFLGYLEKNKCRVLASTEQTYPYPIEKTISCEWLSGSNQSYKKDVFNKYEFDEKLKKYSYKEDSDFSYRIYKKYPGSLYMAANAKLIHNVSQTGRVPKKELIFLKEIYRRYFFYKNISQTKKNKLIFLWSRIGRLFLDILYKNKEKILHIKYTINAYSFCRKHIDEIKRGDLNFFNKELL